MKKRISNLQDFVNMCEEVELDACEIQDRTGFKVEYLGEGTSRICYRALKTSYVVKYGSAKANRSEWRIWQTASSDLRRYLARAVRLSKKSRVLMMEYIPSHADWGDEQILEGKLPKKFHWDMSMDNLRRTRNGWPKLVDYQLMGSLG